ncbi:hypothetical protein Tco_1261674 [Tanacetum coccineum]
MDLLSFIQTVDPTKVRVGVRQRSEGEPKLLDTTVGRVVSLLPISPVHASSELEASVEKLFDEEGSGGQTEQGDSVSGGHGVGIPQVSETTEIVAEDAAPVQSKRQRKRKIIVSNAGGPSHPPKKLKEDQKPLTGPLVAGKSMSALQRLLARAVLNLEVGIAALLTLPFITSYVSVTPERESANIMEAEVDSFARPSIPLIIVATTVTSIVDPATTVKEKFVESSVFGGDSSSGGADHTIGGFYDLIGSDFIIGGICIVISPDVDLQKVYVPQWSVTNGSRPDDSRTCREMVDEFAPPKFFASIRRMDHDQLFTEFNLGAARQMSLSAEVRMRAEYNIREKRRLNHEAEAAEAIRLRAEASKFKVVEKFLRDEVNILKEQNAALEQESTDLGVKLAIVMNDKFEKLYVDFVEMALHLEEKFYPHILTTIAGRRWLLTYGVKLAIVKCLHSSAYLSALGAAISRAIEKGMQDGLAAGITHGQEGRVLTDIATFNPSAKSDYISALQELQDVNFSLLAELKSNKDARTETLMNILRLDEPLAERLGLDESQPHVV